MRTAESPEIEVTNADGELTDAAIAAIATLLLAAAGGDESQEAAA